MTCFYGSERYQVGGRVSAVSGLQSDVLNTGTHFRITHGTIKRPSKYFSLKLGIGL